MTKSSSGTMGVKTDKYYLGEFHSHYITNFEKELIKEGFCVFKATKYDLKTSDDDYYGLCVLLRYQYLKDFSKFGLNPKVETDCIPIDIVDEADQKKPMVSVYPSNKKFNFFGGNEITLRYV